MDEVSRDNFRIIPHDPSKSEQRRSRNSFRVEALSTEALPRCDLLPIGDRGEQVRKSRPHMLDSHYSDFGHCIGNDCCACPVMQEKLPKLGLLVFTEKQIKLLEAVEKKEVGA